MILTSEPKSSQPIVRQAAWSAASSVAAFFAMLIPTAGLALRADTSYVALVVLATWQATLVSALASLGIPALVGPHVARSRVRELGQLGENYGGYIVVHISVTFLTALILSWGGPLRLDGNLNATFGFVALAVSIASQASGNNLLGGSFRNDLVLLVNALTAAAIAFAVFVIPLTSPADMLRNIGLFSLVRPILVVALLGTTRVRIRRSTLPSRSQWIFAYALTVTTVFTFQRLEIGFLRRRATTTDIAAFGVSYDIAQVVRGAATSCFAILIPVFVLGMSRDRVRTVHNARTLALLTTYATSLGGLFICFILRITPLGTALVAGADVSAVAAVIAAASLFATGSVMATLLASTLRYDLYLLSVVATFGFALLANLAMTRTAFSGGVASMLTGTAFVISQSRFSTAIADYPWIRSMALPAPLIAGASVVPHLTDSTPLSAVLSASVLVLITYTMRPQLHTLIRYLSAARVRA